MKIQELHSLHLQMSCNQLDWYGFLGWPDQQADGVLRASRPTLADGQDKGGLEQWRREEEGLAGWWGDQGAARTASRPCPLVGLKYMYLQQVVCVNVWKCKVMKV